MNLCQFPPDNLIISNTNEAKSSNNCNIFNEYKHKKIENIWDQYRIQKDFEDGLDGVLLEACDKAKSEANFTLEDDEWMIKTLDML